MVYITRIFDGSEYVSSDKEIEHCCEFIRKIDSKDKQVKESKPILNTNSNENQVPEQSNTINLNKLKNMNKNKKDYKRKNIFK